MILPACSTRSPADIPALCKVVQGLLIHPLITELYGVDLTSTQKKEVNIRPVSEMLRLMHQARPAPADRSRARPNERVVGNCRDHAVLLCAMLRHQGRPARVRVGFAAYLSDKMISDHWVTEYWDADAAALGAGRPADRRGAAQAPEASPSTPPTCPPSSSSPPRRPGRCAARARPNRGNFGHNRKLRGWPYLRAQLLQRAGRAQQSRGAALG